MPPARHTSWRFPLLGLLIVLTGISRPSAAQQGEGFWLHPDYIAQQWTTQDGLPTHSIRAVLKSRDGYLWIATNDGLVRFDGDRFTVFNVVNTPSFTSNQILDLFEDPDGGLWALSSETLVRYHQGRFNRFYLPGNREVRFSTMHLARQRLWLTSGDGLFFFDEDRFRRYRPDVLRGWVTGLAEDASGNLWVSLMDRGVYLFEKDRGEDEPAHLALSLDRLPAKQLGNLTTDPDGGVWVAVDGGAYHLRMDGVVSSVTAAADDQRALHHIGREKGLRCAMDQSILVFRCELIAPLEEAAVRSIESAIGSPSRLHRGVDGALWYGDGTSIYRDHERVYQGTQGDNAAGFFFDTQGGFWIRSLFSGLLRIQKAPLQMAIADEAERNNVNPILEDQDGKIWMISSGRLLYYDSSMRAHLVEEVRQYCGLYEDRSGTLWVASEGVCRADEGTCVEEIGKRWLSVMYEEGKRYCLPLHSHSIL